MEDLEDRLRAARNAKPVVKEPERYTICPLDQGDSPQALEFVKDDLNRQAGMPNAWVADLPWILGSQHYRVYDWRGGFAFLRPADPSVGALNGETDTLDAAMQACGEDMVKLDRYRRWHDYMLTHEPPRD